MEEQKTKPFYLGNKPVFSTNTLKVYNKYSNKLMAGVSLATQDHLKKAIESCHASRQALASLSSFQRKTILGQCLGQIVGRKEELAQVLCQETGKSITDAKREIDRTINTFQLSAAESMRIYGEVLPIDITENTKNYEGMWKRVPIGPCLFITPFNFPLNLVAHKVAPALAVGCPFIVKPASLTPLSALLLGEMLSKTDLPEGSFSILPCSVADAEMLVTDDRLKLLSFTGSAENGWKLKTQAGKKSVILELGGNAACILDEKIDLDFAVERLAFGAFYQAGQSCISVQRILAHRTIYDELREKLLSKIKQFTYGDPSDPNVFMGPMISEEAAKRVEDWIQKAVQAGATLLCGGTRKGALLQASLLENVPKDQLLYREEAFGPVAVLSIFDDFDEALAEVNNSRYGLQAGLFSTDLGKVFKAWDVLEVGGLIINDVPSFRSDAMPYGGVKDSGLGREGVRFAIEHLTEIRMLAINRIT